MTYKPNIKYIDPMVDYGFKRIFKESGKKNLLIRPLNEIFGLEIIDIDIRESEQVGLTRETHNASYDIFCKSSDGSRFIIEVQVARQRFFLERALFYTSLPIVKSMPRETNGQKNKKRAKQLQKKRQRWNYNYPPVFFLGLLNFDLRHFTPELTDPEQFIHLFSLRDEHTHELMTDRLRFAFLEVARFDKRKEECRSFEDRFLFIMKNLPNFAEEPDLWDDSYFNELVEEAQFANMTERQQERYMAKLMRRWDYDNTIECAKEEGLEKGLAEGREEQARETARRMLAKGYDVATVSECTGLTEDQVRGL